MVGSFWCRQKSWRDLLHYCERYPTSIMQNYYGYSGYVIQNIHVAVQTRRYRKHQTHCTVRTVKVVHKVPEYASKTPTGSLPIPNQPVYLPCPLLSCSCSWMLNSYLIQTIFLFAILCPFLSGHILDDRRKLPSPTPFKLWMIFLSLAHWLQTQWA